MSRYLILVLALTLCSGCDPAATESQDNEPANGNAGGGGTGIVGGMFLADDASLDAVQGGGGGGAAAAPQQNNPPQGGVPAQPQQQDVIQPRRPADLVDKQAAMAANPNLVEVENHVNASDPFSAAAGAYFSAASRIHVLNLKHEIDLMRNLDENYEYPSFEEFKAVLERSGVQLNGLKADQVYAYDQETGSICILEDRSAE